MAKFVGSVVTLPGIWWGEPLPKVFLHLGACETVLYPPLNVGNEM